MGSAGTLKAGRSPIPSGMPFRVDFVGRTTELARLDTMLNAARCNLGGVALLVGEAGIGKTRTVNEFAERARGRGVRVAWGRCWEGEACPAFGPWSEALRGLTVGRDDAQLRQLLGEGGEDIAVILPEIRRSLGEGAAPLKLAASEGVQRLFVSLSRVLRSAARREPLAIILDNLHLADDSSLRFLRHLGPELTGSRLLVVGTCRTAGEGFREALALTFEELAKAHSFLRLELRGLGRAEVREIVACGLGPSPEVGDRIHERTEGNPLFVLELVRQIVTDPGVDFSNGPLPEGIRQVIRRRIERLSPACRDLLATAAVLGRSFQVDILARTHDGAELDRVMGLVAKAEASEVLLAGEPGPRRLHFSHELVREALLEGMPATEKSRLHERAALVLEQVEAADAQRRSVEILHHLVESGTLVRPRRLVERAMRAVDEATERYAPDEALRIVEETLQAWENLGRTIDVRVAPLLHRQGRLLADLIRPPEARESLVRAFGLYHEAGDQRAAIDVALTSAWESPDGSVWMETAAGGGRGVRELRERALVLVHPGSKDHALLLLQRGSRADLLEALDFARNSGETNLEAMVLAQLAYHELLAWQFDASARWLAPAEALAAAQGDHGLLLTCAYTRYCHSLITGSAHSVSNATEEIFALARRFRSLRARIQALVCATFLALKRGDWEGVRHEANEGIALLASSGPVFGHFLCRNALIETELQTGHFKAAKACMKSAAAAGMWSGPIDTRATLLGARITNDPSLLPPAPGPFEIPSGDGPLITFVTGGLLYAASLAAIHGDRRAASFCVEHLRRWNGTSWDCSTDALLGHQCTVLDRLDEALGHFANAIAFCRGAGYLPDLAWAVSDLADTLVRRDGPGDREQVAKLLEEGLAVCQTLGMAPLERRILAKREGLAGSRGRFRAQPDGLTHREIEVLRLVSRGLTNVEIAERLYVSPLTVAKHVHNVLDKTGMANRAEVTAWAARRGFLEDR